MGNLPELPRLPDRTGHFGPYGGRYVPETLMTPLIELETELAAVTAMTRFGVMKHLKVLEEADLVVTRRQGREKLHFLNPVPIRLIHDRWIDKYTERNVTALLHLKDQLEKPS